MGPVKWEVVPSQGLYIHMKILESTAKTRGHMSMPRREFEPVIPVFERSKTVRTLDHAATPCNSWLKLHTHPEVQ